MNKNFSDDSLKSIENSTRKNLQQEVMESFEILKQNLASYVNIVKSNTNVKENLTVLVSTIEQEIEKVRQQKEAYCEALHEMLWACAFIRIPIEDFGI